MVSCDMKALQRRMDALPESGDYSKSCLACFGGYHLILSTRNGLAQHFKGRQPSANTKSFTLGWRTARSTYSRRCRSPLGLYTVSFPWQRFIDLQVREKRRNANVVFIKARACGTSWSTTDPNTFRWYWYWVNRQDTPYCMHTKKLSRLPRACGACGSGRRDFAFWS